MACSRICLLEITLQKPQRHCHYIKKKKRRKKRPIVSCVYIILSDGLLQNLSVGNSTPKATKAPPLYWKDKKKEKKSQIVSCVYIILSDGLLQNLSVEDSSPKAPTPMPLSELAPPPSQDELFGEMSFTSSSPCSYAAIIHKMSKTF